MKTPTLLIITGLPGTGKTTFAKELAKSLKLPLITKDSLKEIIFDTLGWSDRAWSKKVGVASYSLMDYLVESQLAAGKDLIVESNFKPEFDNAKFQAWQENYGFSAVQILFEANGEILYERFKARALSGERHPGHVDGQNHEEFRESLLTGKIEPLAIKGSVITVDTSDYSLVDTAGLVGQVKEALN